jgi:hypothetical protein
MMRQLSSAKRGLDVDQARIFYASVLACGLFGGFSLFSGSFSSLCFFCFYLALGYHFFGAHGVFFNEALNTLRCLRTLADPVFNTVAFKVKAYLLAACGWAEVTELFDEASITAATAVCGDKVVEGFLFAAGASQSDDNHGNVYPLNAFFIKALEPMCCHA